MHAETHAGDARRRGETHMKKISTILLCLFIVAGLCACGRSAKPDSVVKTFIEKVPDEVTDILTCNMLNSMDSLGGAGR